MSLFRLAIFPQEDTRLLISRGAPRQNFASIGATAKPARGALAALADITARAAHAEPL